MPANRLSLLPSESLPLSSHFLKDTSNQGRTTRDTTTAVPNHASEQASQLETNSDSDYEGDEWGEEGWQEDEWGNEKVRRYMVYIQGNFIRLFFGLRAFDLFFLHFAVIDALIVCFIQDPMSSVKRDLVAARNELTSVITHNEPRVWFTFVLTNVLTNLNFCVN